jgi:uncharacterized protein YggE
MKPARIAVVAAALLALAALSGIARPEGARSAAEEAQDTVTVTGTGTVETAPDEATFGFGVVTKARTAGEALAANSAQARRLIAALVAAGVDRKDIRTAMVSLSPRVNDNGDVIIGYTAQNSVSVTLRNLDKAGAIIDAAVAAGANDVQGPSLAKRSQDRLYRDALKGAYDDARTKAQALAAASGRSVGKVQTVIEGGSVQPLVMARAADAAAPTPIEPGTQEIQAQLTVTFALT